MKNALKTDKTTMAQPTVKLERFKMDQSNQDRYCITFDAEERYPITQTFFDELTYLLSNDSADFNSYVFRIRKLRTQLMTM